MRTLLICALFSLLASCKEPPNVDPCLVDSAKNLAYCVPVNTKKPAYDLPTNQLNKYTCYSSGDQRILLEWIVNNSK